MSHNADETPHQFVSTAGIPAREHAKLLAAERRRLVHDVLSERTTPIELGQLAAEIAAQEEGFDAPPEEPPMDVTIDLHHCHLPKLDEAGVLDYDPESRVIKRIDGPSGADERDRSGRSVDKDNAACTIALREHVTAYFDASSGETASLDDLARYAATQLSDTADWPTERIRLRLHHVVLPRLADIGVIDYDPRTSTVRCRQESS